MCFGPESPCPHLPLQPSPHRRCHGLLPSCLRARTRAQPALRAVTLRTKPRAAPWLLCSSRERRRCLVSASSLARCRHSPRVLRSLAWEALFPEASTASRPPVQSLLRGLPRPPIQIRTPLSMPARWRSSEDSY